MPPPDDQGNLISQDDSCPFVCLFVFCFVLFLGLHPCHMEVSQARCWIGTTAASLHYSHRNAGCKPCLWPTPQLMAMRSLTHWLRPGIKPEASWLLVGFIFAAPQWELPDDSSSCLLVPEHKKSEVPGGYCSLMLHETIKMSLDKSGSTPMGPGPF